MANKKILGKIYKKNAYLISNLIENYPCELSFDILEILKEGLESQSSLNYLYDNIKLNLKEIMQVIHLILFQEM